MHIEETVLPGGMVCMVEVGEECPKCGKEMMEIMMFGEVCIFCDSPTKEKKKEWGLE